MKGPLANLDKWQNYAHSLLLAASVFIIHHYSAKIEQLVVAGAPWAWTKLFLFYAFWLFVAGTVIKFVFYFLPEPWRWRE